MIWTRSITRIFVYKLPFNPSIYKARFWILVPLVGNNSRLFCSVILGSFLLGWTRHLNTSLLFHNWYKIVLCWQRRTSEDLFQVQKLIGWHICFIVNRLWIKNLPLPPSSCWTMYLFVIYLSIDLYVTQIIEAILDYFIWITSLNESANWHS